MITETLEETLESEAAGDSGEMTAIEREHYDEICDLNQQVRIAESDYLLAKGKAKVAKEELESLQSQLSYVIARGPETESAAVPAVP